MFRKIKNPALKKILELLLLAVLLWVFLYFAADLLKKIASAQIASLTNTIIKTDSIELSLNGSVLIKNLDVKPQNLTNYDNTIIKAKTLYARFSPLSLLLLKPKLNQIKIKDFFLNAQRDLDSNIWNISDLSINPSKPDAGKLPLIKLEKGTLQYSTVTNGTPKIVAQMPLDAEFRIDKKNPDTYMFRIATAGNSVLPRNVLTGSWKQGSVIITGGIASAKLSNIQKACSIDVLAAELKYDASLNYELKLSIDQLNLYAGSNQDAPVLSVPDFVRNSAQINTVLNIFDKFNPSGNCALKLNAKGRLDRLQDSRIEGKLRCKDVSVCYAHFNYPIEKLTGDIDFTEKSFEFNNLQAKHKNANISLSGGLSSAPELQYQFRFNGDNIPLTSDLYNALDIREKTFWSLFSPSGNIGIDLRINKKPPLKEEQLLLVKLQAVDAKYKELPYPLKKLSGNILFDSNSITLSDIVSAYDSLEIDVKGKISDTDTNSPLYNIYINAKNIPMDQTLREALPEEDRAFFDTFGLRGSVNAIISALTDPNTRTINPVKTELSFLGNSMHIADPKITVTDMNGIAVLDTNSITVNNLTGRSCGGTVCVNGNIVLDKSFNLDIKGLDAVLGDELFDPLPESIKKLFVPLKPAGKINYTAHIDKDDSNAPFSYDVTIDCLQNIINPSQFSYPLENVKGSLRLTNDYIQIQNISASPVSKIHFDSSPPIVTLNGRVNLAGTDLDSADLSFSAENIALDIALGSPLPITLRNPYISVAPTGKFNLDFPVIKIPKSADRNKEIIFDGTAKLTNCCFNAAVPATELNASIKLKGSCKSDTGLRNSEAVLFADSMKIAGKELRNLKATIIYDPNSSKWSSQGFTADCYDGRVTGSIECSQINDIAPKYLITTAFDGIDLNKFLATPNKPPLEENGKSSGKMEGSFTLEGTLGAEKQKTGRCKLHISEMRVGKVSPLGNIVKVLSLDKPEDFAFQQILIDSYIRNDTLDLTNVDISGNSVAFSGSGKLDLKTKNLDVTLLARGKRLANTKPSILQSLTDALTESVVKIQVKGHIDDPQLTTESLPFIKETFELLGT